MYGKNSHSLDQEEKDSAEKCGNLQDTMQKAQCIMSLLNEEKGKFDPAGNLEYSDLEKNHLKRLAEKEIKFIYSLGLPDIKIALEKYANEEDLEKCYNENQGEDRFNCYWDSVSQDDKHEAVAEAMLVISWFAMFIIAAAAS